MAKRSLLAMAVVFLLILMTISGWASVPTNMNYQGKLTDPDGNPLNGTYDMTFYLFSASSGGSALWSENHTSVQVTDGIYSVQLGSLTVDLFENNELYLEVEIEGETLAPRQQLTSTAFSMRSAKSEYAETLDGKDSSEFATTVHYHSFGDITGTATDGQIPDDITINYAATSAYAYSADSAITAGSADYATSASNADTVDGYDAGDFAAAGHDHDGRYYTEAEVDSLVASLQSQISSLQASVNQLTTLLQNVTRAGNEITFSGVNVHIVNATGTTDGTVNGLGNLIVGYNELRGSGDDRTGSHNIVVGSRLNYASYGGLVAGRSNTISGAYASVSGGAYNTASGSYASVSGGAYNTASGSYASVSGGYGNMASGSYASVNGGGYNTASANVTSVSGGDHNRASAYNASVSGGRNNIASGDYSFIGGGGGVNVEDGNQAFANYSAILGGFRNISGDPDLSYHNIGEKSTVSGGAENTASGLYASISGGVQNTASSIAASVSGGRLNTASDFQSSVSGGQNNTASGSQSSVSGGRNNIASGDYSFIGGGGGVNVEDGNQAFANYSCQLFSHPGRVSKHLR